jgi:DNA-binding transcriptional MerR regulator
MLAERTGIPADTIRYDDRAGLLLPPARSPAGYRLSGDEKTRP